MGDTIAGWNLLKGELVNWKLHGKKLYNRPKKEKDGIEKRHGGGLRRFNISSNEEKRQYLEK
jgi:hypothetical protein